MLLIHQPLGHGPSTLLLRHTRTMNQGGFCEHQGGFCVQALYWNCRSTNINQPEYTRQKCIIFYYTLFFSIFTWLYDPLMTVCIIYSIVWATQTCCPFYRHHFRLRKLHLHSFCCKCIWQLEMIAVAAKMELVDANIPSILLKGGTEHLPFENVTR